jgi:ketosteroid isomerase-like protein
VHVLSRDAAYIVRQGVLTNNLGMSGETRLRYAVTQIFTRSGSDWKMAHHHESFKEIGD